jgi:hypothetical protein
MLKTAWSYFTVILNRQGWEDNLKTDSRWAAESFEKDKKSSRYVE